MRLTHPRAWLYTQLSQQKHLLIYHRGTAVVNSAEGATVRAQGHGTSVTVGRQPPPSQPGSHQMQNKRAQVPFAVYDSFVPPLPWKQSHFWSQCWLLKPQSLLKAWEELVKTQILKASFLFSLLLMFILVAILTLNSLTQLLPSLAVF